MQTHRVLHAAAVPARRHTASQLLPLGATATQAACLQQCTGSRLLASGTTARAPSLAGTIALQGGCWHLACPTVLHAASSLSAAPLHIPNPLSPHALQAAHAHCCLAAQPCPADMLRQEALGACSQQNMQQTAEAVQRAHQDTTTPGHAKVHTLSCSHCCAGLAQRQLWLPCASAAPHECRGAAHRHVPRPAQQRLPPRPLQPTSTTTTCKYRHKHTSGQTS
jgi:hypothetical protein